MSFLKSFFDDESKIIGLCGFESMKPKYGVKSDVRENFLKHFNAERRFETNFKQNMFLEV